VNYGRLSFRVQELIRAAIQPVGDRGCTEGNQNAARVKAQNDSGITRPVSKGKQNNAAYIIGRLSIPQLPQHNAPSQRLIWFGNVQVKADAIVQEYRNRRVLYDRAALVGWQSLSAGFSPSIRNIANLHLSHASCLRSLPAVSCAPLHPQRRVPD